MPYRDPGKQREAKRLSARMARAGERGTRVEPAIPAPLRLRTALDALALLSEEVARVREDAEINTTDRARTIGYLVSVGLRAVEAADLAERVAAVERTLALRPKPTPENGSSA